MSNPRQTEERIMQILKRISNPKPTASQKFKKLTNNLNMKLIKISEELVHDTTVSIAYKKSRSYEFNPQKWHNVLFLLIAFRNNHSSLSYFLF